MESENKFYKDARVYWSQVPATIDGVLGGFGHISNADIAGSKEFLDEILSLENPPGLNLALDCGSGIGRVTKDLLIHIFEKVDLVEQDEKFMNTALESLGHDNKRLGSIYRIGLQNFLPSEKYDVIWIQWVFGHLNDNDACAFLQRCRRALKEYGVIIIKENITSDDELEYDEKDSSVTRPLDLMLWIFRVAELRVLKTRIQSNFPTELHAVHMFALVPTSTVNYAESD